MESKWNGGGVNGVEIKRAGGGWEKENGIVGEEVVVGAGDGGVLAILGRRCRGGV